jgi:hypothetical protein
MMPIEGEEQDIQRIAKELIAQYAQEAELIAAGHADTMLDHGDVAAFEIWRKVASAIRAFQAGNPTRR